MYISKELEITKDGSLNRSSSRIILADENKSYEGTVTFDNNVNEVTFTNEVFTGYSVNSSGNLIYCKTVNSCKIVDDIDGAAYINKNNKNSNSIITCFQGQCKLTKIEPNGLYVDGESFENRYFKNLIKKDSSGIISFPFKNNHYSIENGYNLNAATKSSESTSQNYYKAIIQCENKESNGVCKLIDGAFYRRFENSPDNYIYCTCYPSECNHYINENN
ncbi:hypothetical protein PIROE2DRAFT_57027 [Piromyces sp. E2]|nr:hypothetical protein PIROE2DRAFT_57027 [Piromyces sp. E2]|eukprot:OUM70162.1 hypothetical protein PIROE2DRAFT_57027 [Piromyces sp. E2]